jgi:ribosomal protein S18 acetylase RimI-like enzyme
MTPVTVRLATSDDVEPVLGIWARARSAVAVTVDTPEAVERVIAAGALLVAELDGTVVGTLIAASDGWRGNMYRLAVLPEHRRAGIARALVLEGEQLLRARGIHRITALVGREEEDAGALWRAVGYAYDERVVRYVKDV